MKKLLLMSAMLVLAACSKKNEAPAAGETTGEMAPAASSADTGMGTMSHDSAMAPSSDTMMTRDSAK
jgi:outer membrane biogenesis lipoprotein LolB